MVLNPLAEIGVRVLMAVTIGRGEFVMNFQGRGERGQGQEDGAKQDGQHSPCPQKLPTMRIHRTHGWCFFTRGLSSKQPLPRKLALWGPFR